MPKVLVLIAGGDESVAAVAESIQAGARSVRFAECDMMRLPGAPRPASVARLRVLDDLDGLLAYDAVVFGAPRKDLHDLTALLGRAAGLGAGGKLANKVGSVFPAADPAVAGTEHPLWPLLAPMARYGMILVPPGYSGPEGAAENLLAAGARLGKRLVDIAGWISHARSHHHH